MSEKSQVDKPVDSATGAESPTTARPIEFEDEQENVTSPSPTKKTSSNEEQGAPPKPPRPMSPQAHAEATLIEAFPSIDAKVVKAVLVASGGKVEPAFNALLSMSDPDFQAEEAPPPQPPRPTQPRSQLEADELYARQLAEHYDSTGGYEGFGSRSRGDPPLPRRHKDSGLKPNELYDDRDHSFFDDDLPVIKENMRKGFLETQSKVNKWIMDFKKKLDGDEEEEAPPVPPRQNFGPSQSEQLRGIRKSAERYRQSGDRERYDADPHVLSDDFTALELRDEEAQYQRSHRPLANPDLFKPTPVSPPQSGPVDEVDALYRQPTPANRQPSPGAGKAKKWQPLTSIAPNPEVEDHDPFSLGDSDEEDLKKDIKPEDTERLKKVASEHDAERKQSESGEALKPAERSGSVGQIDKAAEELLQGKK